MESVIDIKSVVTAAASGEAASFETLYQHLADRVFAFVMSRTSNRTIAIDLSQDCFVELYKALPKFTYQSDAAFYAFVFTIVRRQLAAHYNRLQATHVEEFHDEQQAATGPGVELTYSVRSALEQLDECSREIVVLHHWSRYTFAEIAAIINMNESAVRVRHHRARATLASVLNT